MINLKQNSETTEMMKPIQCKKHDHSDICGQYRRKSDVKHIYIYFIYLCLEHIEGLINKFWSMLVLRFWCFFPVQSHRCTVSCISSRWRSCQCFGKCAFPHRFEVVSKHIFGVWGSGSHLLSNTNTAFQELIYFLHVLCAVDDIVKHKSICFIE